jgi:hypothetical protein
MLPRQLDWYNYSRGWQRICFTNSVLYKWLCYDFKASGSLSSHDEVNVRICLITLSRWFILHHWQPETVTLLTSTGIFPFKLLTSKFRRFSSSTFLLYELYNPPETSRLNISSLIKLQAIHSFSCIVFDVSFNSEVSQRTRSFPVGQHFLYSTFPNDRLL